MPTGFERKIRCCGINGGMGMVEFVKVSKDGILLEIQEVSDVYRDSLFRWDENE